jgi:predicted metal-dependent HD superfamily phosphohydrolase
MRYNETMLDVTRFNHVWQQLTGQPPRDRLFTELATKYAEPNRYYHNTAHLEDCLAVFDIMRHQAQRPAEVELALWFHDSIYDVKGKENEELSAAWAVSELAGSNIEVIQRIKQLILATKHQVAPSDPDQQLLVDIDLSILGRELAVFDRFDAQIRQEYAWVPEEEYRPGRAKVLQQFLDRPNIYSTPMMRERYEQQARSNLQRAINALR